MRWPFEIKTIMNHIISLNHFEMDLMHFLVFIPNPFVARLSSWPNLRTGLASLSISRLFWSGMFQLKNATASLGLNVWNWYLNSTFELCQFLWVRFKALVMFVDPLLFGPEAFVNGGSNSICLAWLLAQKGITQHIHARQSSFSSPPWHEYPTTMSGKAFKFLLLINLTLDLLPFSDGILTIWRRFSLRHQPEVHNQFIRRVMDNESLSSGESGGGGPGGSELNESLLVRIGVPELHVDKCLQFRKDDLIWEVKQQCLAALPKVSASILLQSMDLELSQLTKYYAWDGYLRGSKIIRLIWLSSKKGKMVALLGVKRAAMMMALNGAQPLAYLYASNVGLNLHFELTWTETISQLQLLRIENPPWRSCFRRLLLLALLWQRTSSWSYHWGPWEWASFHVNDWTFFPLTHENHEEVMKRYSVPSNLLGEIRKIQWPNELEVTPSLHRIIQETHDLEW